MSLESMAIALNHSRATGTAKLVLLGIANHDGDGGSWPSVARLMRYAGGVDRRTAQRAIDKLEQLGEVRRMKGRGGDHNTADHRRPNLYKFLLECPRDCDRTSQHRTSHAVEIQLDEELYTGAAPTPPRGADATGGGGTHAARTIPITTTTKDPDLTTDARAKVEDVCSYRPGLGHVEVGGYCAACSTRLVPYEAEAHA